MAEMSETKTFEYPDRSARDMLELRSELNSAYLEITTLTSQLEEARAKAKRLVDIFDNDDPFDREHVNEMKEALTDLRALLHGSTK